MAILIQVYFDTAAYLAALDTIILERCGNRNRFFRETGVQRASLSRLKKEMSVQTLATLTLWSELNPQDFMKVSQPSTCDPFTAIIQGRRMRIYTQWQSCGRKQSDERGGRCNSCYPLTGTPRRTHGPYYYGTYQENGKQQRVYLGRTLPNVEGIQ